MIYLVIPAGAGWTRRSEPGVQAVQQTHDAFRLRMTNRAAASA